MNRAEYKARWRRDNPEKWKAYWYRSRYGVELTDLRSMLKKQRGKCAICRRARATHLDHDHRSGQVRGILCHRCNTGIGMFLESKAALRRAIRYL